MRFAMFHVCTPCSVPRTSGDLRFVQRRAELRAEGCRLENASQSGRFQRCLIVGVSQPISFTTWLRHCTPLVPKGGVDYCSVGRGTQWVVRQLCVLAQRCSAVQSHLGNMAQMQSKFLLRIDYLQRLLIWRSKAEFCEGRRKSSGCGRDSYRY